MANMLQKDAIQAAARLVLVTPRDMTDYCRERFWFTTLDAPVREKLVEAKLRPDQVELIALTLKLFLPRCYCLAQDHAEIVRIYKTGTNTRE